MLASGTLRGEGIALSTDGRTWLPGAGEYGGGWGAVGKGISVPQGGSFYIKYYGRTAANPVLHYALYGTDWGAWSAAGPALTGSVGANASSAVILRLSNAGTPMGTVAWINGPGKWTAFTAPGAYDLALHAEAQWTLPPITIQTASPPGFWANLFRRVNAPAMPVPSGPPGDRPIPAAVPDAGSTAALLAATLIGGAVAWYVIRRRRRATRKDRQQ